MEAKTREEHVAEAVKRANDEWDRKGHKENIEQKFSIYGHSCSYSSPSYKDSLPTMHFDGVKNMVEVIELFNSMDTVKIYTQKTGCLATDRLEPLNEKSTKYDMQIRINSNQHERMNNCVTFVAAMDGINYLIQIKLNTDLYRVYGRREESMGGFIMKNCDLRYNADWGFYAGRYLNIVDKVMWGSESEFLQTCSLFLNVVQ